MRTRSLSAAVVLAAALAAQQAESRPTEPKPGPTKLTKQQLDEKLAGMRGLFERVMPERIAKGDKLKKKKWLDGFFAVQSAHYLLFRGRRRVAQAPRAVRRVATAG